MKNLLKRRKGKNKGTDTLVRRQPGRASENQRNEQCIESRNRDLVTLDKKVGTEMGGAMNREGGEYCLVDRRLLGVLLGGDI